MSLQINTLHITTATAKPKTPPGREFTISPALYGRTTWNLDNLSRMNISGSGQWTITPTSNFTANVKMWGAAGGRGGDYADVLGGAGGYSVGTVSFQQGTSYVLLVGAGGQSFGPGVMGGYTIGGGGYGRSTSYPNAQGGGMSGLFRTAYTHVNSIIIAGGGGGASFSGVLIGAGGGSSGQNSDGNYSTGGSQSAGGKGAGTGSALLGAIGAAGSDRSAGGGGGYYGGGTGGGFLAFLGASSGGSGYINTTYVSNGSTSAGNRGTPANSADSDRGSSGACIRPSLTGNDGRVIIS